MVGFGIAHCLMEFYTNLLEIQLQLSNPVKKNFEVLNYARKHGFPKDAVLSFTGMMTTLLALTLANTSIVDPFLLKKTTERTLILLTFLKVLKKC